ncbi:Hypothetical predicted protein [Olea europaea subsp. europaea]|uniref:Transcription repressor n=1 Tax=Olea europaea subsp. europaea TaxID=158383 RepID=A0A8S0QJY6_OLEEU|nr:Hypothetical predicted protein [Olea europaea subsp. europaea]
MNRDQPGPKQNMATPSLSMGHPELLFNWPNLTHLILLHQFPRFITPKAAINPKFGTPPQDKKEVLVLRNEIGVLRRDLVELHTEVAVLRDDVAGFRGSVRGSVGETGVPRDWWATVAGINEVFDLVPEPGREGVEVESEVPEEAGMEVPEEVEMARAEEAGVEVPEEVGMTKGVEGGTGVPEGETGVPEGVTEEVAEGTPEVVVEGDEGVTEDERMLEMTDDDVVFMLEGATEYSSSSSWNTTTTATTFFDMPPASYSSDTESDIKSSRAVQGFGNIGGQSVVVEKNSDDPYLDFRQSMLQMILQKRFTQRMILENFLTVSCS